MSEERFQAIENRLDRLEAIMSSAGDIILNVSRLAQQNAQQIERITQQTERNAQLIEQNAEALASLAQQAAVDRVEFREFQRTTQAALERIDRVLDYLMQRDIRPSDNEA